MQGMQYQTGGSLSSDAPSYIGRQADQDLYEALQQGEFCYVLNSRQMGKSSLLVQTRDRLAAEGYRCATLDLTNIGSSNVTPLQWYKGIVKDLWRGFKLFKQVPINDWWKEEEDISLLQRLSYFISEVLLQQFPDQRLVIFIDEVDSTLNLPFAADDFFALVRYCYNQRATNPDFNRICFAMFGVAAPADLIQERSRTPFNIGTAIDLQGFGFAEALPLAEGLQVEGGDRQQILREILAWTQGQPFLTQKLCQLAIETGKDAVSGKLMVPPGSEAFWVEQLVQERMLKSWEAQDEPEHLRTIRNRILHNPDNVGRLLGLYQQILAGESITSDDSPEQLELMLSGLATKRDGLLKPKSRIYERVFNSAWVEQQLSDLRPYGMQLQSWLASKQLDESRLLRGQALKDAQAWSQGKRLSDDDYQFLSASVEGDRRAVRQAMEAERQIAEAEKVQLQLQQEQKIARQQRRFLAGLGVALLTSLAFGGLAAWQYRQSQIGEIAAITTAAEGHFDSHKQLIALQEIITAKTKLRRLVLPPQALQQQVTQVLQRLVNGTDARNRITLPTGVVSMDLHPHGEAIAIVTADGALSLWQPNGQEIETNVVPAAPATALRFSPDGQQLAIALNNRTIELWQEQAPGQFALQKSFSDLSVVLSSLSFSPDGQHLLLKSDHQHHKILEIATGQSRALDTLFDGTPLRHNDSQYSPDGRFLATAVLPPPPDVMALSHGSASPEQPPPGPPSGPSPRPPKPAPAARPSPPSNEPFGGKLPWKGPGARHGDHSTNTAPHLRLWTTEGEFLANILVSRNRLVALAIHPRGDLIALAAADGTVHLYQSGGEAVAVLPSQGSKLQAIAFDATGGLLATADADGMVYIWSATEYGLVKRFAGHKGVVNHLNFASDGGWLASSGEDGTVRLWQIQHPLRNQLSTGLGAVVQLAYPQGQLRSLSNDQVMRFWQKTDEGYRPEPQKQVDAPVKSEAGSLSRSGKIFVGVTTSKRIVIGDDQGVALQYLFPPERVSPLTLSLDADLLATTFLASSFVDIWQRKGDGKFAEQPVHRLNLAADQTVQTFVWSDAGDQLAIGTATGNIVVFDVIRSGNDAVKFQQRQLIAAHDMAIEQLRFSPDGQQLASTARDNAIYLWHRDNPKADYRLAQHLAGHRSIVQALAFSADSQYLASGSTNSIKLWQLDELLQQASTEAVPAQTATVQTPLRTFVGHEAEVTALAFSPDGTELASGGSDRRIIVWKLDEILALDALELACQQVGDYLRHNSTVEDEGRSLCSKS